MRAIKANKDLDSRMGRIFFVLWSDTRTLARLYLKLYKEYRQDLKTKYPNHDFTTANINRISNFVFTHRDRGSPMGLSEFFNRRLSLGFRDLTRNLYHFNVYVNSLAESERAGELSDFVSLYTKVHQSWLSIYTLLRRGVLQLISKTETDRALYNKFKIRVLNNDPFQLFLADLSIEKYRLYLNVLRKVTIDVKNVL